MTEQHRSRGLATKAIHAGFRPDPATGAVNAPIYASSTFAQDGVGGLRGGYEYARTGNPTRAALEASLAAVEEAEYGRAFASGHGRHRLRAARRAAARRSRRHARRRLRRDLPPDRQGVHPVGHPLHGRVIGRPRRGAGRDHAADQADLGGDTDQSVAVHSRYRRYRPDWFDVELKSIGGQHVCLACASAAA